MERGVPLRPSHVLHSAALCLLPHMLYSTALRCTAPGRAARGTPSCSCLLVNGAGAAPLNGNSHSGRCSRRGQGQGSTAGRRGQASGHQGIRGSGCDAGQANAAWRGMPIDRAGGQGAPSGAAGPRGSSCSAQGSKCSWLSQAMSEQARQWNGKACKPLPLRAHASGPFNRAPASSCSWLQSSGEPNWVADQPHEGQAWGG